MCCLLVCGMVTSCRTPQTLTSETIREVDSVYIEKLIPIAQPVDSATIRALLQCDENGKVVLSWLDLANSDNAKLLFQLDSLGNLLADFSAGGDTIYVTNTETKYILKEAEKIEVPVPRELTKWQKIFIRIGQIGFFILIYFAWKKLKGCSSNN